MQGLTYPLLWDFLYYYKLEVVGISQFTYGMIHVIGSVWAVLAVLVYQMHLSKYETRTLIIITIFVDILASFMDLCFVLRWNIYLGIGDITWLAFGTQAL